MKFKLEIKIDNAAFYEAGALSAVLVEVAQQVEDQEQQRHPRTIVRDVNGNNVGWYEVK